MINNRSSLINKCSLGLSFGLSMAFTVWFWCNQATSGNLQVWLFAGCGVLFEITKFFAFPQGVRLWNEKQPTKAAASIVMGVVLSVVSVAAAISVVKESEAIKASNALKNNQEYTTLQIAVTAQMQTIDNLNQLIQEDISKQYRERAKGSLLILEKEQNRLDALQQKQKQIKLENYNPKGSIVSRTKDMFLYLLGSLLEITTCYLLICTSMSARNVPGNKGTNNKKANSHKGLTVPEVQSQVQSTGTPKDVPKKEHPREHKNKVHYFKPRVQGGSEEQGRLLDQIKLAIFNNQCAPTVRNIKNKFQVGTKKAQTILQALCQQGLLDKQGRGYRLAHG
jgi:hypothetical protein